MTKKLAFLALALTGCAAAAAASALVVRHHTRRMIAQEHKADLANWEAEGGKPAASAEHPAHAAS